MDRDREPTAADVVAANRRFYDVIASVYDRVDSRRGGKVDHAWLDALLAAVSADLVRRLGRTRESLEFLDAGAGSGFLAQRANPYFGRITLLDISKPMLERIARPSARKLQGDCCRIPLADESVDFVGAFATLHHLFAPGELLREAARVLRPGGVLYSDHDIDSEFVRRLRGPLRLYRAFFDHGHEYLDSCPQASRGDYHLSEFHGDRGVSRRTLGDVLAATGLSALETRVHWDGMGPLARVLAGLRMKTGLEKRGWAPVVRILAVKETR
jgi:SAM-dependent methyltransferase